MTKKGKKPPRSAERLLAVTANRGSDSAIIGDLEEEYSALVERRGSGYALFWYWRLILISLPSFLKDRLLWSLTMFRNGFKIALRNVHRNRLFAFINLIGLAVGMACFLLISLWVQDELSYDEFHEHKDSLNLLTIEHPDGALDRNVPYALAPVLAAEYPEIIRYTRIYSLDVFTCSFTYRPEGRPPLRFYEDSVELVDRDFFAMFSFPFLLGDAESALESADSLVISEQIAKKYFGDESPLGKSMALNTDRDLIVTGVIRFPSNSHLTPDFVIPLNDDLTDDWNWRDPSYLMLEPNTNPDAFSEKIADSLNRNYPQKLPAEFKVGILPLEDVHLSFGRRTAVAVFSLIAVFILILACLNYMNLATAGSMKRAREVGLRKVVGAKRGQLIVQFIEESLLMSALAFVLALALAKLALPLLNLLTQKSMTLLSLRNPWSYAGLLGLVGLVGVTAGSYPALYLSSSSPSDSLRAASRFRSNRSPFRLVSVVGQFTVSVLLIIGTLVVFRQLDYMRNRPLGFSTEHVLGIRSNPTLLARFSAFKRELLVDPNVLSVTRAQTAPYAGDYKTSGLKWDGKDPGLVPNVRYAIMDFDYFETFDMRMEEGRSFRPDRPGDRTNYMINQAAVRYMNMPDPVGQHLEFWGTPGRIIGVVEDFHHVSLHREIMPQVFTINPRFYGNGMRHVFVKISSGNVPETLRRIGEVSRQIAPEYPFEYSFLDREVAELYDSELTLGRIFTVFAALAIFISCLGILGLSVFFAEQRTKEIGIRKVLGASVPGIVSLLSLQFSRWVLLANAIAWPIAYLAMHGWLQDFAYRTSISPLIFVSAGVLAFVFAVFPIGLQAVRAAIADPLDALRYE